MSEQHACHVEPIDKPVDRAQLTDSMVAYLSVHGMGCPRCATRVRNGLLMLDGVLSTSVFLEKGMATVFYDPERLSPPELVWAVAQAGRASAHHYEARTLTVIPAWWLVGSDRSVADA